MKKYHVVYKTTNLINNKIYIGLHSTNKIDDNYLGSGWVLKSAIKKYGKENFIKEILFTFKTRKEARVKESELVNECFCKRPDTYNLTVGGMGVEDQTGDKNHMYGKKAHNRKPLIADHTDGTIIKADSIRDLSNKINMARGNIRNLIQKGIRGHRGWRVELDKR